MKEIGRRTGISYPTLLRYVKTHLSRIPHEGRGRTRRYPPEAVEVFKELRAQSRGGEGAGGRKKAGRRPKAASADGSLARRLQVMEQSQAALERQVKVLLKELRKPLTVTLGRSR